MVQFFITISELAESLKSKAVPVRQHIRVEVPNGFDAPVALNLPNGFDINANKKYPILVYSYGGPGNYLQMKQISCCVKN